MQGSIAGSLSSWGEKSMTSINTRCNIDSVTNEIKAVDTINNVYGHLCTMCTNCNHGNDIIRKKDGQTHR